MAGIDRRSGEVRVRSAAGEELVFDRLVVCGGLHSDRLAQMAGEDREPWIVPFRGEYYRLVPARTDLVRGLIYPVPDPAYPFLGVHFTRRVDGGVDIGPNAVLAFKREGYTRTDFSAADLIDVFRSQGFRRLARKHWRMGAAEMWGSVSKRAFIDRAPRFHSGTHACRCRAGTRRRSRPGARSRRVARRRLPHHPRGGLVLVRNAPSPAATSSLAIGEYVVDQLNAGG